VFLWHTNQPFFSDCENISIDYAVMENAEEIYVVPAEFGWSALGTWGALHGLLPRGASGYAAVGIVKLYDSSNCMVHVAHIW